MNKSLIRATTK